MHRHARRSVSLVVAIVALVVVALVVAGCMSSHDVIAGRTWKLVSVGGQPPVADARLSLGTDGRISVWPGCNKGSGPYAIDGNRLKAGLLVMEQSRCKDERVNAQEAAVLAVVEAGPVFAVDTGTGQLRLSANDVTLLFDAP